LQKLDGVGLYLIREEAIQLQSYLEQLLADPGMHHAHLSSYDYQKEVTVSIYDVANLEGFDERSKKLIKEDI
jgi:hypothetical protein